jgi:hypothetical protein
MAAAKGYQTGAPGTPIVLLTIGKASLTDTGGYARILSSYATGMADQYPWLKITGANLTQSVNDLEASSNLSDVKLACLDGDLLNPQAITQDIEGGYSFNGKTAILWYGWAGIAQSDFVILATMIVDHTDYSDDNTTINFILRDNSLLINNYTFLYAANGLPTSNQNPALILGAPFDPTQGLLVTALLDAGMPPGLINTAAVAALNNNVYFGTNMQFNVTYPPACKDWIESELLKPLGACWFWNNLGQFTPYSLLPAAPPASVLTLDQTNIAVATLPVPIESELYTSAMTYRMDMNSNGQDAQTIFTDIYAPAANLYGISQTRVIVSRGVRSSLGGMRIAHLMAQMLFRRYGLKPLTLKLRTYAPALLVEVGDKVTINHPLVPNGKFPAALRTSGSSLGITGTLWEILRKNSGLADATVSLDLLHVSWQLASNARYISPDGVPAYSAASSSQRASYFFICNSSNSYSNGDSGDLLW